MILNEQVKNELDKQTYDALRLSKIVIKNSFNTKQHSDIYF